MADPSSFVVTELTGKGRNLILQGRALPYQPFTLEGSMRAEFVWYPGNPVASAQMLGADEKPTTVTGKWKNRFLKSQDDFGAPVIPTAIATLDGRQVEDAFALVTAVDEIRRSGQLLEVTWDSFKRRGILTKFRHSWTRREDVEWEIEFTWISRGESEQAVSFSNKSIVNDFILSVRVRVDELKNALIAPFNVVQQWSKRVSNATAIIEDTLIEMESSTQQVASSILTPIEASKRALASSETILQEASGIFTAIEDTPARAVRSALDIRDIGFGAALEADKFVRAIKTPTRALEALAADQSNAIRAVINQSDLLSAFIARQSMDLREVSTQFYSTPDEWRTLLRYNHLTSSKLLAGQLILIPKIQFSDRSV